MADEREIKPLPGESVHAFLKRIRQTPREEGGIRRIKLNGKFDLGPISVIPLPKIVSDDTIANSQPSVQLPSDLPDDDDDVREPERQSRILACAAELKSRLEWKKRAGKCSREWPGDAYIAPPIVDSPVEGEESTALLHWLYFYPARPILSTLWSTPVRKRRERLLSFQKMDPFGPNQAVFGLIPGETATAEITKAAVALFAANGHEDCRLLGGLPTSIAHKQNWEIAEDAPVLGFKVVRFLFYLSARQLWPRNMNVFCDHLRRYSDPWERAKAAVEFVAEMKRLVSCGEESSFSERQFLEWFDLVSAPDRVAAERENFGLAWENAIRLASSEHMWAN